MAQKNKGFTLIEVMIAITILATLGVLAAQSIQQAIRSKKKIQEQVDDLSRIRDAIRLIERDINLCYHHRDWEKELIEAARKKSKAATSGKGGDKTPGAPAGVAPPENPLAPADPNDPFGSSNVEAPRKDPATQFMGMENELHFVTMNNARLLKDLPQADHVEVGYSLKDCKSSDGKSTSRCLWRRTSAWVDSDVTKGGDEVVLMENVTEFKLRYLGRGKQDWVTQWKSDPTGDAATKGNFPWAVEVSLTSQKEVSGKKGKKYSMQIVAPLHFPNNREEGGASEAEPAAPVPENPGAAGLPGGGG